jgi:hypothetical protein
MRIPFTKKAEPRQDDEPPADEDRADGEEAIANLEGELAEATPTGMPRVKTERL